MIERYRALVVEDDPGTGYALKRLLQHRGWEVTLAGTVGEAIERLALPPDLVLLDLMLPDGEGDEVLRWVRAEGLGCRVVVCTATMERTRLQRVALLEPDAILHKPLEIEEIWEACSRPESPDESPAGVGSLGAS